MPNLIVIAGPNGAGKTTAAPSLLKDVLHMEHFVNADTIAAGLSAFAPEKAAIPAGKAMLERMRYLAGNNEDFAFETTLASRSFAPWISQLKNKKYYFHLVFLYLQNPDLAVLRVKERVKLGGHNVQEDVIRRRYVSGLKNFFQLYKPLANSWEVYDNTLSGDISLIASERNEISKIEKNNIWYGLEREYEK